MRSIFHGPPAINYNQPQYLHELSAYPRHAMELHDISRVCHVIMDEDGPHVEARQAPYGSWMPTTGDSFISAIAIRELAQFAVDHDTDSLRREAVKA